MSAIVVKRNNFFFDGKPAFVRCLHHTQKSVLLYYIRYIGICTVLLMNSSKCTQYICICIMNIEINE